MDDLDQWLKETPDPLVIDVEPMRLCSENIDLIENEVTRIVEHTLDRLRAILPTLPIGRHIRIVTLRKLPGTVFLQSRATPWSLGAACLYRGLRNALVAALNKNGIPAERVPPDIEEGPEAPRNPSSVLSVDLLAEDDTESTVVLAPPDAEIDEEADEPPPGSLTFCERSEFHIYGTKWMNLPKLPSPPWKMPKVDFTRDHT